jgi:hypothetical protein
MQTKIAKPICEPRPLGWERNIVGELLEWGVRVTEFDKFNALQRLDFYRHKIDSIPSANWCHGHIFELLDNDEQRTELAKLIELLEWYLASHGSYNSLKTPHFGPGRSIDDPDCISNFDDHKVKLLLRAFNYDVDFYNKWYKEKMPGWPTVEAPATNSKYRILQYLDWLRHQCFRLAEY